MLQLITRREYTLKKKQNPWITLKVALVNEDGTHKTEQSPHEIEEIILHQNVGQIVMQHQKEIILGQQ